MTVYRNLISSYRQTRPAPPLITNCDRPSGVACDDTAHLRVGLSLSGIAELALWLVLRSPPVVVFRGLYRLLTRYWVHYRAK